MKNRAHHEGLKCSPYEAKFGQPMKVGLKISNPPDETINDIQTEEKLDEIISANIDENETTIYQQQSNNVDYIVARFVWCHVRISRLFRAMSSLTFRKL